MEYQPKKFFGKINFSSNDQYKVKRPNYEYPEKKEKEEKSEKKIFYNSKMEITEIIIPKIIILIKEII